MATRQPTGLGRHGDDHMDVDSSSESSEDEEGQFSESVQTNDPNESIPGNTDAMYSDTVDLDEQAFVIRKLKVNPYPMQHNEPIIARLRGRIPEELSDEEQLAEATLRITISAAYTNGQTLAPLTQTMPLANGNDGNGNHLAIFDNMGVNVDQLMANGSTYEIVAAFTLQDLLGPEVFEQAATWTFEVEAVVPEGSHLFAFTLEQELGG